MVFGRGETEGGTRFSTEYPQITSSRPPSRDPVGGYAWQKCIAFLRRCLDLHLRGDDILGKVFNSIERPAFDPNRLKKSFAIICGFVVHFPSRLRVRPPTYSIYRPMSQFTILPGSFRLIPLFTNLLHEGE